jgi:phosphoribosylformimino-5-aminoimidazole carboxamide ribotide isomerase
VVDFLSVKSVKSVDSTRDSELMEVIPAIDIRDGRCVRLYQGDYGQETVYSEDPVEMAAHWVSLGATRLHLVDLDGAKAGAPANLSVVKGILSAVSVPVQLGGGIRTLETARAVASLGVDRVMLGTTAVETPDLVGKVCQKLGPESVVVSVDARDGYVAVKGWTQSSRTLAPDLIRRMADSGVRRFMYTDISRDGTLTEPNFAAIESLIRQTGVRLLAAGGISSVQHLLRLADIGVEGAVIGRALYTGDIDLSAALEAVKNTEERDWGIGTRGWG